MNGTHTRPSVVARDESLDSLAEEGRTGTTVTLEKEPLLNNLSSTAPTAMRETRSHTNGASGSPRKASQSSKSPTKTSASMPSQTMMAGACFCLASGSMTLLNKAALSSFHFKATEALLFFQCFVAVVLVQLFKTSGYIKVEPFNWNIVKVWYPANIIFVGMIITSFWALKDLGVATVTVLKNLTNLIVVTSEYFLYGRVYNRFIWLTMALMVLSAAVSGWTDMSFSASGYFWQMVNSAFTAANMLYLKVAMEKVKKYTSNGERLDEFSMVFYNNLLSLPLIFLVMAGQGELGILAEQEDLRNPAFLIVAMLSGLVGFGISFSVLWFLSTTTPTTFSLVGSLNKIPISFIGLLLYESTYSMANLGSISIGLASGVVFVLAKQRAGG